MWHDSHATEVWQQIDSDITMWLQGDSDTTVMWQSCDRSVIANWQRHNNVTARWQWHDSHVTAMWQCHDNDVSARWQWHDSYVTARWQWHTIITYKFSPLQNSTTDCHDNHLHCHHLWANHHQLHYLPTTPIILYTFTAITALQPNKAKMCSLIILFLFSASSKKLIAEQ